MPGADEHCGHGENRIRLSFFNQRSTRQFNEALSDAVNDNACRPKDEKIGESFKRVTTSPEACKTRRNLLWWPAEVRK
jgi:hypothetical protein